MRCKPIGIHRRPCRSIEKQLAGAAITAALQASLISQKGKAKEGCCSGCAGNIFGCSAGSRGSAARAQMAVASGHAAAALQHLAVSLADCLCASACSQYCLPEFYD